MRIAEINMLHTGSTGKIMFGIADCARKAGYEVRTFSPVLYGMKGKKALPCIPGHTFVGSRMDNAFHIKAAEVTGFHGCFSQATTLQLLKELDQFQPDIIHLHNLHKWCFNLPMLFGYIRKNKIRTVWTLHDCWSFTGKCPHFVLAKCDKWKTGCSHCSQLSSYPKSYSDRTAMMWKLKRKWFSGLENMVLVTPSQWLASLCKQSFLKDYPVKVINNGIDLNIFRPRESDFREKYGLDQKYILLGIAFDWSFRKGLDVFKDLSCQLPDSYQIVLVGTNDLIDKELPDKIISIHSTNSQQDLAEIYSAADVFVNPTREDTYPTVNMEALACGIPVVTFDTGGSPEILDNSCGIVVPVDNNKEMLKAIRQVCEIQHLKTDTCLSRAKQFDITYRFKEYIELYEDLAHCP